MSPMKLNGWESEDNTGQALGAFCVFWLSSMACAASKQGVDRVLGREGGIMWIPVL